MYLPDILNIFLLPKTETSSKTLHHYAKPIKSLFYTPCKNTYERSRVPKMNYENNV